MEAYITYCKVVENTRDRLMRKLDGISDVVYQHPRQHR